MIGHIRILSLVTTLIFFLSDAVDDEMDCEAPPILENCRDLLPNCDDLASYGECISSPDTMMHNCPQTCGHCLPPPRRDPSDDDNEQSCRNFHEECDLWASQGKCNQLSVQETCPLACDQCSVICRDLIDKCTDLAQQGDCTRNPRYMNVHCRKSCQLCSTGVDEVE